MYRYVPVYCFKLTYVLQAPDRLTNFSNWKATTMSVPWPGYKRAIISPWAPPPEQWNSGTVHSRGVAE